VQSVTSAVSARPAKRIVFAEGEEPSVIRAAYAFKTSALGTPILVGREEVIARNCREVGLDPDELGIEIANARVSHRNAEYTDFLYGRLQRSGFLRRDVVRLINQDRNSFAATMVALGHADGMVTGVTRAFDQALEEVRRVIDPAPGGRVMGLSVVLARGRTLFVADTAISAFPVPEHLVAIAREAVRAVRRLGHTPRVAFMSYSAFGNPPGERGQRVHEAVELLDREGADFEYEGEMPPDVALDPDLWANYPFQRLTGPANVLIMPAIHSASISTKLIQALGGATVVGPLLLGLNRSVQICQLSDSVSKILTMATMAAYDLRAQ
jgi:malate dehydrogenase (oxaloacetate-decarboxylating)(NADP+)